MFRSLFGRMFQANPTRPVRRPARRTHLGIDVLEARDVPALLTVNGTGDTIANDGLLTLREAMSLNTGALTFNQLGAAEKAQVAGTIGTNDRIVFAVGGTISLGGDLPTLNKTLNIQGPGADVLTINGNFINRPINVSAAGNVTVSGLKLLSCHTTDSGGAAINNGQLNFYRVDFDGNSSANHGAVIENNGTLTVDECYFHNNSAAKVGGAIDNNATAFVSNSTFSNNTAGGNGGAIWSEGALHLVNVTIAGNHSKGTGGGLRLAGGTTNITSCTIVGNDCDSDITGSEFGGGISNSGSTVTMNNTVVAQNLRFNKAIKNDIEGAVNGEYNFVGVDVSMAGGITNGTNHNRVGTTNFPLDPMLLALAANGGFAPTMSPIQGSPLVGSGAPDSSGIRDQRGAGRAGAVTIGALQIACPLSPVGTPDQLYGPGPISSADEAFVKGLYRATLLRDADPAGLANWLAILAGHPEKRADVVHGFYNSVENRSNQVKFYYNYFLGREADPAGLASWVNQLQSGVDEAVVVRGFALSDEFTGKNNNTQFVNTLYFALLGRNADPAGFASWKGDLDNGTLTRAQEIDLFLRSTETVQRVVMSYYESYLSNVASFPVLNTAVAAIQSGYTFGSIAETVLGSQAFYDNGAAKVGK